MDALLSEQVSFEHGGAGGGTPPAGRGARGGAPRIELPFLQLVLTRLWTAEGGSGPRVLRRATLQRMGGANGVVRAHLGEAWRASPPGSAGGGRDVPLLVTPSRTKIAHTPGDLAGMMEAAPGDAAEIERW